MTSVQPTDPVEMLGGKPVATIPPAATLSQAVEAFAADNVGLLVVVDPAGVQGVLSERDIVNALADGVDLEIERVRDVATLDLLTIDERASVLEAARAMAAAEIRHIAVARKGVVTGVLSIRDVLAVLIEAQAPADDD